MRKKSFKFFALISILIIFIISSYFVFAAIANAPSGLKITRNTTILYDEGNFSVNWTQDTTTGDGVANYTLFIYSNGVLYNKTAKNDSAFGFNFNNFTEANYTFFIVALNSTSDQKNATSNISIYVDRTAPTATLPEYVNGTAKKNSTTLTLNVSVSDALSGLTGSTCWVNINGTNQTIAVNNGWCNITNGNLTGLADGNRTIKVYVNDSVGNLVLNNSFVVQIDTTNPMASAACTPSTVNTGDTLICTCSGTDATSGINSSLTTDSLRPSTPLQGSFSYDCSVTDNSGNSHSTVAYYTVSSSGSSGSSGSSSTSFWTAGTYSISENIFVKGYTQEKMAIKSRLKVRFDSEDHYIGIIALNSIAATINISSEPIQIVLNIGQDAKLDVNNNGYYDIYIKLNSISDNKASITVQKINEKVSGKEFVSTEGNVISALPDSTSDEDNYIPDSTSENIQKSFFKTFWWLWVVIGLIIAVLIVFFVFIRRKK